MSDRAAKPTAQPRGYVCPRTVATPRLNGSLDDDVWGHASWTDDFVDIEGDHHSIPRFRTRAKMMWDDDCLDVAADMDEPHVWGALTDHDAVIYFDNDFEVFLDPGGRGHHYGEIEVNALNTTWDLLLSRPYRAGGSAFSGWEMKGVQTAVHIHGTLNNPIDVNSGWQVEIAIPWTALREVGGGENPLGDGDQWRINFSRVEWQCVIVEGAYAKVPDIAEDNWVWSPMGAIDMHRPERWGILQFSSQTDDLPPVQPLREWEHQLALVEVWEAQQTHHQRNARYSSLCGRPWTRSARTEARSHVESIRSHLGHVSHRSGATSDNDLNLRSVWTPLMHPRSLRNPHDDRSLNLGIPAYPLILSAARATLQ